MPPISELLNFILSGTTLIAVYTAWRSRKSTIKQAEATALSGMQAVYDKMVTDTDRKLEQMREEIRTLHLIVDGYKQKCEKCTHNKA